jgi:Holliday junction DNA helicase RuvA
MIGKLRGKVDGIHNDSLILDVNGVGYVCFASTRTLGDLEAIKGEVSLMIETHVREDHIHLYGFITESERDWFRLLTTVQGVGAKMGLAILAVVATEDLPHIIAAQDTAALTQANGVGKKLAERIVNELKNKVDKIAASAPVVSINSNSKPTKKEAGVQEDAVSALVNLGYQRLDAYRAVGAAMQGGADGLDAIITASLKELAA